ncbi:hypothetical protein IEQ34_017279 [Dendrobium chrysotoxum]|uniref:Uncharacterized protein n=1 Tax=Dendrobium chrysotoxum TaxID=161865 RepID=A0AAV7FTG6_DENCH|nr:hypothetical protein IEQ34_017279 [Dendrobium chrysotoxum]
MKSKLTEKLHHYHVMWRDDDGSLKMIVKKWLLDNGGQGNFVAVLEKLCDFWNAKPAGKVTLARHRGREIR